MSGRSTLNSHTAALEAAQRSFESAGDQPKVGFGVLTSDAGYDEEHPDDVIITCRPDFGA